MSHYRTIYQLAASEGKDAALAYVASLRLEGVSDVAEMERACDFLGEYQREGVVILRNVIPLDVVRDAVDDIWDVGVLSLPWCEDLRREWETIRETFRDDPWRDVTKEESDRIKAIYPMTGGFGALTQAPAFHLRTQWQIRQDPVMVALGRTLLGCDKVMVSLDRVSLKFHGQGETEFAHWDSDPHEWPAEAYEGMQGIVSLCHTKFYAAPRTHTNEFREKFIQHYPKLKRSDQYHITPHHDPLGLLRLTKEYSLGPGDYVVWSNRVLHEARINRSATVRYAYFIQYFPHSQPAKEVLEAHRKANTNWLEDRMNSYATGCNPYTFPGGTVISLYSKSALMYHPHVLNEFCARFTTTPIPYTYKSGKKKGQTVNIPAPRVPLSEGTYTPPELTELGKSLLH